MGTFVDLAWDTDSVQTGLKAERPSDVQGVASLNIESSNQLLETLEESNGYLER